MAGQQNKPQGRRPVRIKVRATRLGYYEHRRRREGDVFVMTLASEETNLPSWVERADARVPERTTGAQEALNRAHDGVNAIRQAAAVAEFGGEADSHGANAGPTEVDVI